MGFRVRLGLGNDLANSDCRSLASRLGWDGGRIDDHNQNLLLGGQGTANEFL